MVGVAFEDSEGAIDLLEKHHASEFMGERHFAEREGGVRGFAGGIGEPVSGTDGEDEDLRVAILVVLEELGEFLGGELAPTRVEENDGVGGPGGGLFAEFEEGRFVGKGETFDVGVTGDSLEVFSGQGLDGAVFRFADPGYF